MLPSTTSVISSKGVSQPAKPKDSFKNISEVDETNRRERFGKSLSVTSSVIDPQEIIQPKKTPRLNLHIGSKFAFALFPFVVILFAYGVIFYHLFHLQYITVVVRQMQSEAYTIILAACLNITVPEEDVYCQLFEPPDGINLICPDNSCDSSERCKSGITCRLSCEEWHRPMPKLTVTCLASGYWNMEQKEISTLTCVEVQCSEVQDRDCANLFGGNASPNEDGTYLLVNCRTFEPLPVICDDSTMGGGWTVVQSRVSGKTDFYRTFEEFEQYFGSPDADYWLGLENLHLISKANAQSLLVESRDTGYQMKVSEYDTQLPEGYLEAGDSLTPSNDMQVTEALHLQVWKR